MKLVNAVFFVLFFCAIMSCSQKADVPAVVASEALPGGNASVSYKPFPSFMRPVGNLPETQRADFYAGKALANQPWIKAPTITTARDGLGPVYNARSCLACHINGGKGQMPRNGNDMLFGAFVRISLPNNDSNTGDVIRTGVVPDPVYGDQLQSQSVALFHQLRGRIPADDPSRRQDVPPEAYVYIDWQYKPFVYQDGKKVSLRYPKLRVESLGYGKLGGGVLTSIRNAPAIHGVGLLELISQKDLERNADPLDIDGDGISGRVNQVWDFEYNKTVPGRFGWKANRANLRIVTAAAFAGDVGISNPIFPDQPCTVRQLLCNKTPDGNGEEGVELPEKLLDLVIDFTRNLGVPRQRKVDDIQRRQEIKKGRKLFYQVGCSSCHVPSFITEKSITLPHLGEQIIWPYSDLLLHDMGLGLADGRPDYMASASEWRTPPLWGTGLNKAVNGSNHLLHDGRAQSTEEAILWHGGEAEGVRQAFIHLASNKRSALIQFVDSL